MRIAQQPALHEIRLRVLWIERERALDPIRVPQKPVDVIAQHIVGLAALSPIELGELFALLRRAHPFADLTGPEFDQIVLYLEGGGASLAKQYAGVFGKIRVERGVVCVDAGEIGAAAGLDRGEEAIDD